MYNFQQDQEIQFDNGMIQGCGKVVGCACIPQAVIGAQYIIKVTDGQLPNKEYPFDTISVFECHILESS